MRMRAVVTAVLAMFTVAGGSVPALADTGAVTVEVDPPAVLGTGTQPADINPKIINSGGTRLYGRLKIVVAPVPGGPGRRLDQQIVVQTPGSFGRGHPVPLETVGDTVVARVDVPGDVEAHSTTTVPLQIFLQPDPYAPYVGASDVVLTTSFYGGDDLVVTDATPDRIALVEPRLTVTGWPDRFAVGQPVVLTAGFVNTTPLTYGSVSAYLLLYRRGEDNKSVRVERRQPDGSWTALRLKDNYVWEYDVPRTYKPGESSTVTLRVTFDRIPESPERLTIQHDYQSFVWDNPNMAVINAESTVVDR